MVPDQRHHVSEVRYSRIWPLGVKRRCTKPTGRSAARSAIVGRCDDP